MIDSVVWAQYINVTDTQAALQDINIIFILIYVGQTRHGENGCVGDRCFIHKSTEELIL